MKATVASTGLHNRHRDRNGEISRKHGNTLIRTLRKTYGPGFATGCGDTEKLTDVLHKLDEPNEVPVPYGRAQVNRVQHGCEH